MPYTLQSLGMVEASFWHRNEEPLRTNQIQKKKRRRCLSDTGTDILNGYNVLLHRINAHLKYHSTKEFLLKV